MVPLIRFAYELKDMHEAEKKGKSIIKLDMVSKPNKKFFNHPFSSRGLVSWMDIYVISGSKQNPETTKRQ
eukprot:5355320-Amphidinium_carterae.1